MRRNSDQRNGRKLKAAHCAGMMAVVAMLTSGVAGADTEIVAIAGIQSDEGDKLNRDWRGNMPADMITLQDLCDNKEALGAVAGALGAIIEGSLAAAVPELQPATEGGAGSIPGAGTVWDKTGESVKKICTDGKGSSTTFSALYASCFMSMKTEAHEMYIDLSATPAYMKLVDHPNAQVVEMMLEPSYEKLQDQIGQGWTGGMTMIRQGDLKDYGGVRYFWGLDGTVYKFESKGGLGGMSQNPALGVMASMVTSSISGTGGFTKELPGYRIIETFYNNLADTKGSATGFFAGLDLFMAFMLEEGMPIWMTTDVRSKVMGMTLGSGKSHMAISRVDQYTVPGKCRLHYEVPADYAVQNIDEMIAEATNSGGGSGSGRGSRNSGKMDSLSDQELEMLRKLGMDTGGGQARNSSDDSGADEPRSEGKFKGLMKRMMGRDRDSGESSEPDN